MKRFLSVLLILCLLLPLAACGEKSEAPAPAPAAPTEPEPAPATEPEPQPEPEPVVYTAEDVRTAVVQTALAHYYHDPYVQYDNYSLTETVNLLAKESSYMPEDAEADEYLYTVCSDFSYRVWKQATGWAYVKNSSEFMTGDITGIPADDPLTVCKFGGKNGDPDREAVLTKMQELLEPGDIITYNITGAGHSMIYVGDVDGDGHGDIIHSTSTGGGRLDRATGENPIEPDGSIFLQSVDDTLFAPDNKRNLRNPDVHVFNVIRPLNVMETFELSPAAQMRVKYPYLEVHETFDRAQFQDVQPGETMECKVTLTNHSANDYKAIPVALPLPEGQTFDSCSAGGAFADGQVRWTADVPAGKTVDLSYRLKAVGKPGDRFTFLPGTVDTLPLRTVTFCIGGKHLTDSQLAALAEVAAGKLPQSLIETPFRDLDTVNVFYRDVLGMDPRLPQTAEAFFDTLSERKKVLGKENKMRLPLDAEKITDQSLAKMLLERHAFGLYMYTGQDTRARVIEFMADRYQPGDVFISTVGGGSSAYVATRLMIQIYLGNDSVLTVTSDGCSVDSFADTVRLNLRCDFGFAIRPTQAYDDLAAAAPAAVQPLVG